MRHVPGSLAGYRPVGNRHNQVVADLLDLLDLVDQVLKPTATNYPLTTLQESQSWPALVTIHHTSAQLDIFDVALARCSGDLQQPPTCEHSPISDNSHMSA